MTNNARLLDKIYNAKHYTFWFFNIKKKKPIFLMNYCVFIDLRIQFYNGIRWYKMWLGYLLEPTGITYFLTSTGQILSTLTISNIIIYNK